MTATGIHGRHSFAWPYCAITETDYMAALSRWLKRHTKKAKPFKRSGSAQKPRAAKSAEPRFGWRQARGFVLAFAAVVGLAGAAYGWWAGEPYLIDYVNAHHSAQFEVRFTNQPVNVEGVRDQLVRMVLANISDEAVGTHAKDSLRSAREALAATGWFDPERLQLRRDLVSDSKSPTGTRDVIVVHGPFRRPFALVRYGRNDHLVDEFGRRLPPTYDLDTVKALPVITGCRAQPANVGELWTGKDLRDGINLLTYLVKIGPAWLSQVRQIDVSNAGGGRRGEGHLVLITDKGYRIAWGRAVGEEGGIDQPPIDKIRVLNEYAKQRSGRVGDPLGLLRIDQPLATLDRPETRSAREDQ